MMMYRSLYLLVIWIYISVSFGLRERNLEPQLGYDVDYLDARETFLYGAFEDDIIAKRTAPAKSAATAGSSTGSSTEASSWKFCFIIATQDQFNLTWYNRGSKIETMATHYFSNQNMDITWIEGAKVQLPAKSADSVSSEKSEKDVGVFQIKLRNPPKYKILNNDIKTTGCFVHMKNYCQGTLGTETPWNWAFRKVGGFLQSFEYRNELKAQAELDANKNPESPNKYPPDSENTAKP